MVLYQQMACKVRSEKDAVQSVGSMMTITGREFQQIRSLIYNRFGINLTDQKRSLVVSRLSKLLRTEGFSTFNDYYNSLLSDRSGLALTKLIDRISTNYTFFNREKDHFDFLLKTALPEVLARLKQDRNNSLRIWCAGCSTGEEAYMLVMLMLEFFGREYAGWDAGILATDISHRVITIAKTALYEDERVNMMPEQLKRKYLKQINGGDWLVNESLREEVTFRRFNLMNTSFPFKKPFQIIFCRNVMIYFDRPTRDALIKRFHQVTAPGGYLFIGHSETLGREQRLYKYIMPAVYRKEAP